jgi:hypothetical protein
MWRHLVERELFSATYPNQYCRRSGITVRTPPDPGQRQCDAGELPLASKIPVHG